MPNPILLEVFKNRFASIAEEMGVTLTRTAYSPNIKERRDLSCAVFDARGEMIAQASHIPVHLGSMPLSVCAAIEDVDMQPGDMVIVNDPFRGGTHLPDITCIAPVYVDGAPQPVAYVANRAHHADVGGMSSGSMPLSRSIFQEGIVIPPLRAMQAGAIDRSLIKLILANVRTPAEREGDFAAQFMANTTGVKRFQELIAKYGLETVNSYSSGLMDYAERVTRQLILDIPDGSYIFDDVLDGDGLGGGEIPISVTVTVNGDTAVIDFSRSADQVAGSVNAVRAITLSAVLYVIRSLVSENIPTNAGCLRPVTVLTRPGSVLDAAFPAAVAGGNVETSQRVVDVLLGALSQALPDVIPAASQGTMNNLTIGGMDPRTGKPFAYYETLAGGMGAGKGHDGESAIHSHMTNTMNTPVEALEYSAPFRVKRYQIRKGSGGGGLHRGGDGLVREIELLAPAEVTVLAERRMRGPYGLAGGDAGLPGENVVVRHGVEERMPGKFSTHLEPGDAVRIESPGGGGWGWRERMKDEGGRMNEEGGRKASD